MSDEIVSVALRLSRSIDTEKADDVASPKHYGFLARDLDPDSVEELDHSRRSGGANNGSRPFIAVGDVDGMKSINVLWRSIALRTPLSSEVARQRQLHQYAVYCGIGIQFASSGLYLLL